MSIIYRPLSTWPQPPTDRPEVSPFTAPWADTVILLNREVGKLSRYPRTAPEIVIEIDVIDGHVRQDGQLHANYRLLTQRCAVSFESKHGPLRYCCDAFVLQRGGREAWQANVRAVALGLEALRRVTRYGISTKGEAYTGWAQLGTGTAAGAISSAPAMTKLVAAQFLADWGAEIPIRTNEGLGVILDDRAVALRLYRVASKRLHPDTSDGESTPDLWRQLEDARRVLEF